MTTDYLATADAWTVLDLIVAEGGEPAAPDPAPGPTTADLPGFFIVRAWLVSRGEVGWPFTTVSVFPEGRVVHAYVGCCCGDPR